jgi:hypothetical protein
MKFRSIHLAVALVSASLAPAAKAADQAWVEMAPGSASVARLVTSAATCPSLVVDGRSITMAERVAPATLPARANKAKVDAPLAFPGRVCEHRLPRATRRVAFAGKPLPLPRRRIDRIVVIGDTGCRLKAADDAWQGCNDTAKWPFAAIAERAAAMRPDLVLHVGDYLYRENACPAGKGDCADAVWGYGEASWRADFLDPAAPLLAAAPWVMVRGNHEECARAGEGWWRMFDPHAFKTQDNCVDPAHDASGDRGAPYSIDLGDGTRIAVADLVGLANAGKRDDTLHAAYRANIARIASLLRGSRFGIVTAHYPLNPVSWRKDATDEVSIGSKPIKTLGALGNLNAAVMIAGHVHEFQVARFSDRPTQVIAGFSGTAEDPPKSPATLSQAAGKPGAETLVGLTTVQDAFGFCLMERQGKSWKLTAYNADGTVIGRFRL